VGRRGHTGVREEDDARLCLLVIIGVRWDGSRELVALANGFREAKASWLDVVRDLLHGMVFEESIRVINDPPEQQVLAPGSADGRGSTPALARDRFRDRVGFAFWGA
jgi:hypothetical protein